MGLENAKVGDALVIYDVNFGEQRTKVSAVARKYLTAGGRRYSIETGCVHDNYGNVTAYTPEQWARLQAFYALRAAIRAVADTLPSATLSDEDMRALTAELDALAARLKGTG